MLVEYPSLRPALGREFLKPLDGQPVEDVLPLTVYHLAAVVQFESVSRQITLMDRALHLSRVKGRLSQNIAMKSQ
jgi:hypothetical protein